MRVIKSDIHDGKTNVMRACKGNTYAKRKVDLLHQLGHHDVTESMFEGLTERQIDMKARNIIMS